jgi:murein DD-endopeptidase MepM/ murein hydrolase activator NlpD
MTEIIKVKIVDGFKKTSGFGWRFVPKWKRDFIALNGQNAFEKLIKGNDVQDENDRNLMFSNLKKYQLPKNSKPDDVFKFHNGLDFIGNRIDGYIRLLAIADGKIITVATNDLSGNYIKLSCKIDGVNWTFSYCHLADSVPTIKGKDVEQGEWIANMGNSGVTSTGIHCHLTVLRNGEVVNPEEYWEFI